MPRARRSTRLSGATTKYTSDPFEVAGVSDDSDFAEKSSASRRQEKQALSPEVSSDEEYKEIRIDEEEGPEAEDNDEDEDGDGDGDLEMIIEEPNDEDELDDDDTHTAKPGKVKMAKVSAKSSSKAKTPRSQPGDRAVAVSEDETHFRGTWNPIEHMGKVIHMKVTFGTDERDLLSMVYTRERFAKGVDAAFPTRASLNEAPVLPDYKYGRTFGAEPEDVEKESTRGWDWYYADDIGGRMRKRQRVEQIGEEKARLRYMTRQGQKQAVFIGPVDGQKRFDLDQNEAADFGEAWRDMGRKSDVEPKTATREGWLLNLGQKIQGIAWAPNQPGLTQYLAIIAPISEEQKKDYPDPMKNQAGLAFRPSPPYPCALQIWAFKAKRDDLLTKTLDMTFKPRLRLALCMDWGDLRRIAWCPMPRIPRDEDDEDPLKSLGLLAGVWGDGYVRVLDVKLNRDPNATEFKKIHSPIFEAKLPSTVCTCVAWLSPTDIAVGCANGFVALWSIIPSSESSECPMPYFYEPIHRTYVLNLTSAYPTHPHLLCTTAMDGETRMSSIIDYQKDTVETNRMRMGSPYVSYSPWLHSFLSSDENDFVRLLAVRRFYTMSAIARLPSTVSALAPCSSWHPSILVGCAGGAVIATNPIRRLLHIKEKQWQQTWFTHEWIRGNEAESAGMSRFIDGYRAESIMLSRNMVGDRKMVNGTMMLTIFNESTHVTALAWNPNQACAGWASAALGSGLLRVEDLAI